MSNVIVISDSSDESENAEGIEISFPTASKPARSKPTLGKQEEDDPPPKNKFELKYEKARHKKREYKKFYKEVEEENRQLRELIDEMTKKIKAAEENPTSEEAIKMAEENDHFKQLLYETEGQRDEAQQNYNSLKASFDVCAANNETYVQENIELKKANDEFEKANKELAAASLKCLDARRRVLEHKKIVSRCFMQVMKENADIRSVLQEHLEQENKYREKLHEEQLNVEEIMKSTETASKHANDPDIDDFDKTYKFE